MRKILLILLIACNFTNLFAQWQKVETPAGIKVNNLYITNSGFYAGTSNGVYLSNYPEWKKLSEDVNFNVSSVLSHGGFLFAGTTTNGIYRSGDHGSTWLQVNNNLTSTAVKVLQEYKGQIIAGTSNGLFISGDNGIQWVNKTSNIGNTTVNAILSYNDSLFVGTQDGIFMSSDTAKTWVSKNSGLDFRIISDILSIGSKLFASTTNGGVFMSVDAAKTWASQSNNLTNLNVNDLFYHTDTLFAGTSDTLYYTTDLANLKWKALNAIEGTSVNKTEEGVFIGNADGVFISTADTLLPNNNGFPFYELNNITRILDTTYLSTGKGIYKNINGGWMASENFPSVSIKNTLVINDSIILISDNERLHVSYDSLKSWELLFENPDITSLLSFDDHIFIGTGNDGVFRSDKIGSSFLPYNIGLTGLKVKKLLWSGTTLVSFSNDYNTGGIFISHNKGEEWSELKGNNSLDFIHADITLLNNKLFCGTGYDMGLYALIDVFDFETGKWSTKTNGLLLPDIRGSIDGIKSTQSINEFDTYQNNLYARTQINQIIYSDNFGESWSHIGEGLPYAEYVFGDNQKRFLIETSENLYFISTKDGLYSRPNESVGFKALPTELMVTYDDNKSTSSKIDLTFVWKNEETNVQYLIGEKEEVIPWEISYKLLKVIAKSSIDAGSYTIPEVDLTDASKKYFLVVARGNDYSVPLEFNMPFKQAIQVTSVNQSADSKSIKIYPNPSSSFLQIDIDHTNHNKSKLEVFNFSGMKIIENNELQGSNYLDISNWEQGVYYLRIINNENGSTYGYKILKQ